MFPLHVHCTSVHCAATNNRGSDGHQVRPYTPSTRLTALHIVVFDMRHGPGGCGVPTNAVRPRTCGHLNPVWLSTTDVRGDLALQKTPLWQPAVTKTRSRLVLQPQQSLPANNSPWPAQVWSDTAWSGMAWSGMVKSGLNRCGLVCTARCVLI